MYILFSSYVDITGKTDIEESVEISIEDTTIDQADVEESHEILNMSSSRFFRWNRIFGLSSGNPYAKDILNLEHEDDLDSDDDDDASCSSASMTSDTTTASEGSDGINDNNGQMSELLDSIL